MLNKIIKYFLEHRMISVLLLVVFILFGIVYAPFNLHTGQLLEEGEEIVTNGTFSIDMAAQLAGKTSMMNPLGGAVSTGHNHGEVEQDELPPPKNEASTHIMVKVGGLCEMHKDRIETAAKSVRGVESANWEFDTKMLHIQKAVAKVGHDTDKFKASDEVYSKLPECCLYERLN